MPQNELSCPFMSHLPVFTQNVIHIGILGTYFILAATESKAATAATEKGYKNIR